MSFILLKKQFHQTREGIFQLITNTQQEIFHYQPEGYNNTIHWHLGHILTTTEQFLFREEGELPPRYDDLFGYGSSPANWEGEVPDIETLIQQLKDQLGRIEALPDSLVEKELEEEVLGNKTIGELVSFTAHHETFHYGQIHALKRIAEANLTK